MLLEVYDTEDNLILSLPDFSMEEVETCFQAIMSGESSEEGLAKSLGISISEDAGKSLKQKVNYQNDILLRKITKPTTNLERPEGSLSNGKISESFDKYKDISSEKDQCSQIKTVKKEGYKWREYIEISDDKYRCKICYKIFKDKILLKKHVPSVHKVGARFQCIDCLKMFCYQTQFEEHKLVHSEDKTFVCDECGVMFKTQRHIRRHKIVAHESDMKNLLRNAKYECCSCDKKFQWKSKLEAHTDSRHGGKIYPCDRCQKSYRTKDVLRSHYKKKHGDTTPKVMTDEELKKKREYMRLYHVRQRQKQKSKNGGVLRTGEERIKFNEYMKNWNAKRRAKKIQKI